nr:XRE family transcriptional regulator [Salinicoccus roseus]
MGKIVKNKRESMGIKQTDFADRLGIHKSTLSKYEKGMRKIPMDDIGKMAEVLGMSIEDLLLERQTVTEVPIKQIPVVSQVSAGMPIYAEENIIEYTYIADTITKDGREYFGLKVDGDSMDKEFRPGDIVIIEKGSCIENGQVGVVQVNGYNATLKRVKYVNDSLLLLPESNNPAHEPQVYNNDDEVTIIGRVVGLNRKY